MCEAVCSYDALRLGLDAFGILVRGPSRLGKRGRGRQHRSSSAARLGMPTSKGKRSGCALRAVCARRSAWLCASSGQLRTAAACLSCKQASSRLCVTRPLGLPSRWVGGSRGPRTPFRCAAASRTRSSALPTYLPTLNTHVPMLAGRHRHESALLWLGASGVCSIPNDCRYSGVSSAAGAARRGPGEEDLDVHEVILIIDSVMWLCWLRWVGYPFLYSNVTAVYNTNAHVHPRP